MLALLMPCAAAMAQNFPPGTATIDVPPPSNDPADRLAQNLVELSKNPRNVAVLIDAGRSAIAVGDYNAALSFLASAEQYAPNNGRVKAALGSALVMVERPADAIKLFGEAAALGLQEFEFAGDRGLAYDLQGENRRAQRDYQMALRYRDDDEITRRLALSLGISGERDAALRLLDPLLRRQDVTGWRARAFVLAMNGGSREAETIAATVMPQGMGDTMRPFLRKLALLNAVDRAHAVNFGTMPSDNVRMAGVDGSRLIPAPELAPPGPAQPVLAAPAQAPSKAPRRRPGKDGNPTQTASAAPTGSTPPAGPGFSEIFTRSVTNRPPVTNSAQAQSAAPTVAPTGPKRVGERLGPVDPKNLPPEIRPDAGRATPQGDAKIVLAARGKFDQPGDLVPVTAEPSPSRTIPAKSPEPEEVDQPGNAIFEVPPFVVGGPAAAKPAVTAAAQPAVATQPLPTTAEQASVIVGAPLETKGPPPAAAVPEAPVKTALATVTPPPSNLPEKQAAAAQPPFAQPSRGLLGLLDGIEPEPESVGAALPSEVDIKLAKLAAQRKAADAANKLKTEKELQAKAEKAKADKAAAEAALQAKRNPARTWVQVATGANESGLAITWKRLREKAPDALKGLNASYTPFKATNRILVGPFKSAGEARALVNALSKAGHASNLFSSEAGQEILKIASK